jgi:acyl-CoA dehydrogenase
LGMVNGTLNPMTAFMGGKLKVHGDMSIAMKLQSLFQG